MASDIDFIRQQLNGEAVVAIAQAVSLAVALTDDALVTGRRGLFGRFGTKFERYDLAQLTGVNLIPNPTASYLRLDFGAAPARTTVSMLVPADARSAFEPIIAALQQRVARFGRADS